MTSAASRRLISVLPAPRHRRRLPHEAIHALFASVALASLIVCGAAVAPAYADSPQIAPPQPSTAAGGISGFTVGAIKDTSFDWAQRARTYDAFVYDSTDRGSFTTLRTDATALNMPAGSTTYKLPAYYGDTRVAGTAGDGNQEALNQIASVVGATLVGIDKSDQDGEDYVDQLRTFFHPDTGVAMNTPSSSSTAPGSNSIWYATIANVLYYMLGSQYPDATDMTTMLRSIADQYDDMVRSVGGASADFTMQYYDFASDTKVAGTRNEGGEAAVGAAAILLWAHDEFGDDRYLESARWAMDALERSSSNLYYEVIPVLAPYLAARLNAETNSDYDVQKYFKWLMQDSSVRKCWGTVSGVWGDVDVSGLGGSRSDSTGYAFAMNSFATPLLAATAKYDPAYANVVGQWIASLNSSARSFFADQMPANEQYYGDRFINDPANAIAYEGLMHTGTAGVQARGDIPERSSKWGVGDDATSLGLYGSSWIGFMGAAIHDTDQAGVLRTDLNALDFFGANSYPTSLYYNPGTSAAAVTVALDGPHDLFDSVTGRLIASNASGDTEISVPAGGSVVLVELPAGAETSTTANRTEVDGHPIAWDRSPSRDLAAAGTVTGDGSAVPELNDGDDTTVWTVDGATSNPVARAAGDSTSEAVIDLGGTYTVSQLRADWGRDSGAADVVIETSVNGSSWVSAATDERDGATQTYTFEHRPARYVRVSITPSTTDDITVENLSVYSGDLAARRDPVVSSSINTLNIAAGITDGSDSTRWESKAADPQSVTIDLGDTHDLGSVRLNWETAAGRDYSIDVSDDGQSWSQAYVTTAGAPGDVTIALPEDTSGRYVRMTGTARTTKYAYSLFTFEVYSPLGTVTTAQEPGDPDDGGTDQPGDGGTDQPGDGGTDQPGDGGTDQPGDGGTDQPGDGGTGSDGSGDPVTGGVTATGDDSQSLATTGADGLLSASISGLAALMLAAGVVLIRRRSSGATEG